MASTRRRDIGITRQPLYRDTAIAGDNGHAPMHVSVVVCTYNRAASLPPTLAAFDVQATPPGLAWELIVVDNNSADATRGVVERFGREARMPVRYVFEGRQGLSWARNAGVASAAGRIVAFTDDDACPAPDWVASIAAAMPEDGPAIVGGRIMPAWTEPPPAWLTARPRLWRQLAILEHASPAAVVSANRIPAVWGANMAFRREVFAAAGSFDPRRGVRGQRLYRGEELDLVGRALALGYRAVYDPRIVVWHRVGAERMRVRYFARLFFRQAEGHGLTDDALLPARWFGVPRFRYRWAAARLARWLRAAARRQPEQLDGWLRVCEAAGLLWGYWKAHLGRGRGTAQVRRAGGG
jgi:glycosyltransferase involved in cell wall biosynthesis